MNIKTDVFYKIEGIKEIEDCSVRISEYCYENGLLSYVLRLECRYIINNDEKTTKVLESREEIALNKEASIELVDYKYSIVLNEGVNVEAELKIEEVVDSISKEEIVDYYKEKLTKTLDERVVSTTKDKRDEVEFIKFFDETLAKKYKIKTLYCPTDSYLNEISKEYNIDINTLLSGYDRESKRVIFKISE